MTKNVGGAHHVSEEDIYTLDGTSLINKKKFINKIEQLDLMRF